jgi:hypothetical protein
MMHCACWHRPGRTRNGVMTCRHCGVAIQWCPCAQSGSPYRSVDHGCRCCQGSQFVAVVRSERSKFAEALEVA